MPAKKPATIAEYIAAAPAVAQPHLRKMYALLKAAAPSAQEAIKWGAPFFIEPRYLFSFSAFKAHLNFAPSAPLLKRYADQLGEYGATKHMLKIRYDQPFPTALIKAMAKERVLDLRARDDDSFW